MCWRRVGPIVNTDAIAVDSPRDVGELWVDLSGGQLGPGATAEADGHSEIELTVTQDPGAYGEFFLLGSNSPDSIRAGALTKGGGINLNASKRDRDADITFKHPFDALIDGAGGADRIRPMAVRALPGRTPRGSSGPAS